MFKIKAGSFLLIFILFIAIGAVYAADVNLATDFAADSLTIEAGDTLLLTAMMLT